MFIMFTSGSLSPCTEETEEIETIFTVSTSSKTNTANELWKHLCGPQIFFFVREQHLNLQDNACTEATQLCVHTRQGPTAAGSVYSKHCSRLPEKRWDRKTVAATQDKCYRASSFLCSLCKPHRLPM